jgi:hypothetical protein
LIATRNGVDAANCFDLQSTDLRRFTSQVEARMACFSFIEGFCNPARRHSALGYRSPLRYEEETQIDRNPPSPEPSTKAGQLQLQNRA